jgi:hypothetical protein
VRRFVVWVDRQIPGDDGDKEIVEMPDDATDAECDAECLDCMETMISNSLDTGWQELKEGEEP